MLLTATLRHPAMLRYLDNADNAAGIERKNAREIMELHTMVSVPVTRKQEGRRSPAF